jgi:hypothetical protein
MPITKFLVPLTPDPIDSIAWDKSDHLFAISASANKLYVYTVTTGTVLNAPGSPHTISNPSILFVKPLF